MRYCHGTLTQRARPLRGYPAGWNLLSPYGGLRSETPQGTQAVRPADWSESGLGMILASGFFAPRYRVFSPCAIVSMSYHINV